MVAMGIVVLTSVTGIVVLTAVVVIGLAVVLAVLTNAAMRAKEQRIRNLPGWEAAEIETGIGYAVAFDPNNERIGIEVGSTFSALKHGELSSAEVAESGRVVVTSTNTGSQLARVAVGGLVGGVGGAIIGGVTASSTSAEHGSIEIRIYSTNPACPYIRIPIASRTDRSNSAYDTLLQLALQLQGRIAAIINQRKNDTIELLSSTLPIANQFGSGSLPDELKKLSELMEKGLLSDEEFRAAKERLLRPPASS